MAHITYKQHYIFKLFYYYYYYTYIKLAYISWHCILGIRYDIGIAKKSEAA